MKCPPNLTDLEQARWYVRRAQKGARLAILLAVLSAVSTVLTLAYMVTR